MKISQRRIGCLVLKITTWRVNCGILIIDPIIYLTLRRRIKRFNWLHLWRLTEEEEGSSVGHGNYWDISWTAVVCVCVCVWCVWCVCVWCVGCTCVCRYPPHTLPTHMCFFLYRHSKLNVSTRQLGTANCENSTGLHPMTSLLCMNDIECLSGVHETGYLIKCVCRFK